MTDQPAIERVLRHDRMVVLSALGLVVAIASLYTIFGFGMNMSALEMTAVSASGYGMGRQMLMPATWSPSYAVLVFLMWWVMMIAMMVPSAAPTVLLHAALTRKTAKTAHAPRLATVFLAGYLVAWAGFSVLATALQWALELHGYLSPTMMALVGNSLAGAVLLLAGVYQLTPLKNVCLDHCRSPFQFLLTRHRAGLGGVFRMGLEHGSYCLGCCWFLMALLFVGGIMNLYWIAGLALFVAVEKLAPMGGLFGRIAGGGMIAAGLWVLVRNYA
jgi:predicted metal-binding membrane protein